MMKAINAIIIVLLAVLVFSTYILVSKIMPKSAPVEPAAVPGVSQEQITPEPVVVRQQRPQVNIPTIPAPPSEQPVMQTQSVPEPPVKEEPKLRPARDIKVVMYMTDW